MRTQSPSHSRNWRSRQRWPVVSARKPRGLLRRKILFTLAGAILIACAISSPLAFVLLLCGEKLVALVIAGFLVAATVRMLGPVCLGAKGSVWHTRWAAPIFLLVALVAVNTALRIVDRLGFAVLGTGPFLSSAAAGYVLIALELVWIAVLR